jgi:nucleotide-binding universal stress UspA family protein
MATGQPYPRVIVALDGSNTALKVLAPLKRLLGSQPAEVQLVYVLAPEVTEPPFSADPRVTGIEHTALCERIRASATAYLEQQAQQLAPHRTRCCVLEGNPAELLVDHATQAAASLLAIATHGRSGLARWILGSVATRVLQALDLPLLVATLNNAGDPGTLHDIIAPTDGSEPAQRTLTLAAQVALAHQATVTAVSVVPLGQPAADYDAALRLAAEQFTRLGVNHRCLRLEGDPVTLLLAMAAQHKHQLIALSTHGRGALPRTLLGTVAEGLLRASPLPLLVRRGPSAS